MKSDAFEFHDTTVCLTGLTDEYASANGQLAEAFKAYACCGYDVYLFDKTALLDGRSVTYLHIRSSNNFVQRLTATHAIVDLDTGEVVCEAGQVVEYPLMERVLLMVREFPQEYVIDVGRLAVGRRPVTVEDHIKDRLVLEGISEEDASEIFHLAMNDTAIGPTLSARANMFAINYSTEELSSLWNSLVVSFQHKIALAKGK